MIKKAITKTLLFIGNIGIKTDVNTNCPFIHFQPRTPVRINEIRKSRSYDKTRTK